MATPPPGSAGAFSPELCGALARLAAEAAPRIPRLDAAFRRKLRTLGYDRLQVRALCAIAAGAALQFFGAAGDPAGFAEEVEYHGRRLAKLNLAPWQVLEALAEYPAPEEGRWQPVRDGLRLAVALGLHTAFYQVRESETQVFYGLFRAETEAAGLDALLRHSIEILARALRAQAGRLVLIGETPVNRRLGAPLYIEAGSPLASLIIDPELRGRHASYWSIPFRDGPALAAVAQFGFSTPYRWLPRELTLLDACAERCLAAVRRARMVRDLADREEQVRQLAGHLICAGEEERGRISRELHDEAGQTMLVLRLELEKMEKNSEGAQRAGLARARELAEHAIAEVRRAVAALSPAVLERLGLPAALRQMTARLFKPTPVTVGLRIGSLPALSEAVQTVIYRLAQECCQNVVRHAAASRVKLSLASSDGWLELSVTDNGAGFDLETALRKPDSYGLAGMRERVALMGGKLHVRSRAGCGTHVVARLPLPAPEDA